MPRKRNFLLKKAHALLQFPSTVGKRQEPKSPTTRKREVSSPRPKEDQTKWHDIAKLDVETKGSACNNLIQPCPHFNHQLQKASRGEEKTNKHTHTNKQTNKWTHVKIPTSMVNSIAFEMLQKWSPWANNLNIVWQNCWANNLDIFWLNFWANILGTFWLNCWANKLDTVLADLSS